MQYPVRNDNVNPDYYELHEQDFVEKCDICRQETMFSDLQAFDSVMYNSSILVCRNCLDKINKGEDLSDRIN